MSALSIQVPFPVFQDRDGQPLDNGYVWLGTSSLNPQTNPVVAYYDSALTIVATQPLRTLNGFISRAGSPAQVYVDAVNFSILVQDRQGTTVFSVPEGTGISPNASGVVYDPAGTGAVATTVQEVLRQTVNPLKYGAIGNGSTDDTAAVQAAVDAGYCVDFLSAAYTYKITGAITLRSGQTIIGSGATIKQTTNVTSIFNVVNKTNINISGLTFDDTGAGYVTNDSTPHAAVFGGTGTAYVSVSNCKFTNVTYAALRFIDSDVISLTENIIVGPGVATLPSNTNLRCYGILIDTGSSRYIANNNQITGTTHGIRVEGSANGTCNGNVIYNIPGQHGFYIGANCQNLTISANSVILIALQGIKVQAQNGYTNTSEISITGNIVASCSDSGITFSNGAGATVQTGRIVNSIISGNTLRDIGATAINVQNADTTTISSNAIYGCTFSGISISANTYTYITSNLITNCALSGIRDQTVSTPIFIENNILHNVATAGTAGDKYGIFLQNIDATTIIGNRVTSGTATMQYACYLAAGTQTNSVIDSNYFVNAVDYALRIPGSSTNFFSYKDNLLDGTAGKAYNNPTLTPIASAATLTLPTREDVVKITGTTNITAINTAGHTGHRITMVFADVLTVTRGGTCVVASNFITSVNDTLTMVCDGDYWLETSRSAN